MIEWIVCAESPTRAMERMRTGEVVRCRDCRYYDGEYGCTLLDFAMSQGIEDGFCSWGRRDDAN